MTGKRAHLPLFKELLHRYTATRKASASMLFHSRAQQSYSQLLLVNVSMTINSKDTTNHAKTEISLSVYQVLIGQMCYFKSEAIDHKMAAVTTTCMQLHVIA